MAIKHLLVSDRSEKEMQQTVSTLRNPKKTREHHNVSFSKKAYHTTRAQRAASLFGLGCKIINSNNIIGVGELSSNYIPYPPQEGLINSYHYVSFTGNLLCI